MKKILLILNDSASIEKIISLLTAGDFLIDTAENGLKGYETAIKNIPDLIISDKQLYTDKGGDIILKLRNEAFFATIPFIFLVNDTKEINSIKPSELKLDFYLVKDFTSKNLYNTIDNAFEKSRDIISNIEKKLSELRGSISFSLPHEFITPLNGILGFTGILIQDFDNLDRQEVIKMLGFINNDAQRLKKLTDNFLVFAELEMILKDTKKLNALRKAYFINPRDIITKIAKQIATTYQRDNDLVFDLENAAVRISEDYIKKLMQEIIDNAFKFSKAGTPVIINLFSNDRRAMLSVSDSGTGMTAEQIADIGAYMQFDRSKNEQRGSGLGLTIAKKIAELHAAEFSIESTVHEGTKVNIIFEN
jgi:two-component system, sensor histidine kinase and response regulator